MTYLIPGQDKSKLQGVFDDFSDGEDAANVIDKYFMNIGKVLNDKLPHSTCNFPLPSYNCSMSPMRIIDVLAVELYITRITINKSSGLPMINSKLLKLALHSQSTRFCRLLNLCISHQFFLYNGRWVQSYLYPRKVVHVILQIYVRLPFSQFQEKFSRNSLKYIYLFLWKITIFYLPIKVVLERTTAPNYPLLNYLNVFLLP